MGDKLVSSYIVVQSILTEIKHDPLIYESFLAVDFGERNKPLFMVGRQVTLNFTKIHQYSRIGNFKGRFFLNLLRNGGEFAERRKLI